MRRGDLYRRLLLTAGQEWSQLRQVGQSLQRWNLETETLRTTNQIRAQSCERTMALADLENQTVAGRNPASLHREFRAVERIRQAVEQGSNARKTFREVVERQGGFRRARKCWAW